MFFINNYDIKFYFDQTALDNPNNKKRSRGVLSEYNFNDKEEISVKKIKVEIPFYTMQEFIVGLQKIKGEDINTRISMMAKLLLVRLPKQNIHQMWLTTENGEYLFLELTKGPFNSQAFYSEDVEKSNYKYLNLYESDENDIIDQNSLLSMRFSDDLGELKWIRKGKRLSGNQIADLYLLFEKVLVAGLSDYTMVLYDDSNIPIQKDTETKFMNLKRATLWKKSSWYEEKLGYSIMNIENCQLQLLNDSNQEEVMKIFQSRLAYQLALNNILKTSISTYYQFTKKYESIAAEFLAICKRIYGHNFDIKTSLSTLQVLQRDISKKALNTKDSQDIEDQLFLSENVFKPYIPVQLSIEENEFLTNLQEVDDTRILTKRFLSISNLKVFKGIRVLSKPTSNRNYNFSFV